MKRFLLHNLRHDVYCRLKPSRRHGIGVFAIKNIPVNVDPFRLSHKSYNKEKLIRISSKDIRNLNASVKELLSDFSFIKGIPYLTEFLLTKIILSKILKLLR